MTLKLEHWKPVVGHEERYQVSNTGRVWNIKRQRYQTNTPTAYGYHTVGITQDGKSRNIYIHHLVAEAFIGARPTGMEINHKDLAIKNNFSSNLEYITPLQNAFHYLVSRKAFKKLVPNEVVQEIRESYSVLGPKKLAEKLGLNYHAVVNIGKCKRRVDL